MRKQSCSWLCPECEEDYTTCSLLGPQEYCPLRRQRISHVGRSVCQHCGAIFDKKGLLISITDDVSIEQKHGATNIKHCVWCDI